MVPVKSKRKVVKTLAKGQITIPREFRDALRIDSDTLLSISVVNDHLEIVPLRPEQDNLRHYTKDEVTRFLNEDKIDRQTAQKVRELLHLGEL